MVAAAELVNNYVQGATRAAVEAAEVERASGVSDEQWWEERTSFWEEYFDPERFPAISAVYDEGGYDEPARRLRVRPSARAGRDRGAARRPLSAEHGVRAPERDPLAVAAHPELVEHVQRGDVRRLGQRDDLADAELAERARRASAPAASVA